DRAAAGVDFQYARDLDESEEGSEDVLQPAGLSRPETEGGRARRGVVSIALEETEAHRHRRIARVEDGRVGRERSSGGSPGPAGGRQVKTTGRARRGNVEAISGSQIRHGAAHVAQRRTRARNDFEREFAAPSLREEIGEVPASLS